MTTMEKTFAFGLPVVALVLGLLGCQEKKMLGTSAYTSPPGVVDIATISGTSNCSATPQHPFMVLTDQNLVYFNAADYNPSTGTPVYWVEFGTSTCVNAPSDSGNNYRVPSASTAIYGYSRPYAPSVSIETDVTYIICNDSPVTPPPKCSNGPSMDGLHVKPGP